MTRHLSDKMSRLIVSGLTAVVSLSVLGSAHALTIPNTPLGVTTSAPPMTMLVVGRDHKLFYEAYNDASDLNGDGQLDIRFNPSITYYGLFDSSLCYSYNGTFDASTSTSNGGMFQPHSTMSGGTCSGQWSGNFLNYLTTSRIDALRKVLYGGHREVDTGTQTVLRRAYIPQDAHSWAKEYTSVAVDGYNISHYTPLAVPNANRRHFFGSLTPNAGTDCSTLNSCSNRPPWLSVVTNSNKRVWEWASTERPVLSDGNHGGTRTNYTVRVEVCTSSFHGGCKQYPNLNYKPVGLLHDYGETDAMLFGLLTGSYNKNMSGGVLRKVISSFAGEVNTSTTGTFKSAANSPIVRTLNALRIRDFNNGRTDNAYRGGWTTTQAMQERDFVDWGNPVAEMMFEATRYLAGKGSATSAFNQTSGTNYDSEVGLPTATWDNPYNHSLAKWCSKPNMLVVSDVNPSFDSDQLPGSPFGTFTSDLTMSVANIANSITTAEAGLANSMRFIGQSTVSPSNYDGAPTAKRITSLSTVRGLAPEEPTKQGSYFSAAVAHWGKTNDVHSISGRQTIDNYFVALASPLPKIEFRTTLGRLVTLVPFSKSVGGSGVVNTKGQFQPTNQIVDFYVESVKNTDSSNFDAGVNGGRPYAKFRINFEDVEQGADHDMDVIAEYEVSALADGTVQVKVKPIYQAGGIQQNMGYVISGTNRDGVYLVAQDENVTIPYYLNVPPGQSAGYCDTSPMPASCGKLPWLNGTPAESTQVFSATAGAGVATLMKDPLWYAAKWGGFSDRNGNNLPDLNIEWDADADGTPDTYFLVQNPLRLKDTLRRTFDSIIERNASSSSVTSNSTSISTETHVFQSVFNSANWSGNLIALRVTATGVSGTPTWQASDRLPTWSARKIFTVSGGSKVPFEYSRLSAASQTALGSATVVNYLRGDVSQEVRNGGSLRTRASVLGDIVHSSPFYVKDTDTVYVSGNDGMLHAFNATTGQELFAFIPSTVLDHLAQLSSPTYSHRFFVDGDIAVSTVAQTGRNYLVGSLGRGGKGLFGLDVSDPAAFAENKILWEYKDPSDPDLGYMLGAPVIAQVENGSWVVLVGNGYNSSSAKAVLYVFDLATGALLRKIDTLAGSGSNGMATPTPYDADGNGRIDRVYAGDLHGNVWKFDVSAGAAASWASSFTADDAPAPFFVAKDASNNRQPITAPIGLGTNPITTDPNQGKLYLFFGTGRYLDAGDPNDTSVQSWYGLIDEGTAISGRSSLVARQIVSAGTVDGREVRSFSTPVENDMLNKKGWYIDLLQPPSSTAQGERIVTESRVYALRPRENVYMLLGSSIIPVVDPCTPGGYGYLNAIDPFTGGAVSRPIIDINKDGKFDSADNLSGAVVGSVNLGIGMPSRGVVIRPATKGGGTVKVVVGGSGGGGAGGGGDGGGGSGPGVEDEDFLGDSKGTGIKGRVSWREIVR